MTKKKELAGDSGAISQWSGPTVGLVQLYKTIIEPILIRRNGVLKQNDDISKKEMAMVCLHFLQEAKLGNKELKFYQLQTPREDGKHSNAQGTTPAIAFSEHGWRKLEDYLLMWEELFAAETIVNFYIASKWRRVFNSVLEYCKKVSEGDKGDHHQQDKLAKIKDDNITSGISHDAPTKKNISPPKQLKSSKGLVKPLKIVTTQSGDLTGVFSRGSRHFNHHMRRLNLLYNNAIDSIEELSNPLPESLLGKIADRNFVHPGKAIFPDLPPQVETFMQTLHSEDTLRASKFTELIYMRRTSSGQTSLRELQNAISSPRKQKIIRVYLENSGLVLEWLCCVLHIDVPKPSDNKTSNTPLSSSNSNRSVDLITFLRDGISLCKLVCTVDPIKPCSLIKLGPAFSIHRVMFFLEACREIGVQKKHLFTVTDPFVPMKFDVDCKHRFRVLRTLSVYSRHLGLKGYKGPYINFKNGKLIIPDSWKVHENRTDQDLREDKESNGRKALTDINKDNSETPNKSPPVYKSKQSDNKEEESVINSSTFTSPLNIEKDQDLQQTSTSNIRTSGRSPSNAKKLQLSVSASDGEHGNLKSEGERRYESSLEAEVSQKSKESSIEALVTRVRQNSDSSEASNYSLHNDVLSSYGVNMQIRDTMDIPVTKVKPLRNTDEPNLKESTSTMNLEDQNIHTPKNLGTYTIPDTNEQNKDKELDRSVSQPSIDLETEDNLVKKSSSSSNYQHSANSGTIEKIVENSSNSSVSHHSIAIATAIMGNLPENPLNYSGSQQSANIETSKSSSSSHLKSSISQKQLSPETTMGLLAAHNELNSSQRSVSIETSNNVSIDHQGSNISKSQSSLELVEKFSAKYSNSDTPQSSLNIETKKDLGNQFTDSYMDHSDMKSESMEQYDHTAVQRKLSNTEEITDPAVEPLNSYTGSYNQSEEETEQLNHNIIQNSASVETGKDFETEFYTTGNSKRSSSVESSKNLGTNSSDSYSVSKIKQHTTNTFEFPEVSSENALIRRNSNSSHYSTSLEEKNKSAQHLKTEDDTGVAYSDIFNEVSDRKRIKTPVASESTSELPVNSETENIVSDFTDSYTNLFTKKDQKIEKRSSMNRTLEETLDTSQLTLLESKVDGSQVTDHADTPKHTKNAIEPLRKLSESVETIDTTTTPKTKDIIKSTSSHTNLEVQDSTEIGSRYNSSSPSYENLKHIATEVASSNSRSEPLNDEDDVVSGKKNAESVDDMNFINTRVPGEVTHKDTGMIVNDTPKDKTMTDVNLERGKEAQSIVDTGESVRNDLENLSNRLCEEIEVAHESLRIFSMHGGKKSFHNIEDEVLEKDFYSKELTSTYIVLCILKKLRLILNCVNCVCKSHILAISQLYSVLNNTVDLEDNDQQKEKVANSLGSKFLLISSDIIEQYSAFIAVFNVSREIASDTINFKSNNFLNDKFFVCIEESKNTLTNFLKNLTKEIEIITSISKEKTPHGIEMRNSDNRIFEYDERKLTLAYIEIKTTLDYLLSYEVIEQGS